MSASPENVLRTPCGEGLFGTVSGPLLPVRLRGRTTAAFQRRALGSREKGSASLRPVEPAGFVGPARRTVVGDEHCDPRQWDRGGDDRQRDKTVVPQAICHGGQ